MIDERARQRDMRHKVRTGKREWERERKRKGEEERPCRKIAECEASRTRRAAAGAKITRDLRARQSTGRPIPLNVDGGKEKRL